MWRAAGLTDEAKSRKKSWLVSAEFDTGDSIFHEPICESMAICVLHSATDLAHSCVLGAGTIGEPVPSCRPASQPSSQPASQPASQSTQPKGGEKTAERKEKQEYNRAQRAAFESLRAN